MKYTRNKNNTIALIRQAIVLLQGVNSPCTGVVIPVCLFREK